MPTVRRIATLIGSDGPTRSFHVGIAAYARHHPNWELYPLWENRIEMLRQLPHPADGVITSAHDPKVIQTYCDQSVPLVNLLDLARPTPIPVVCGDNYAGGQQAAKHLLELGIRSLAAFGFVGTVGPDSVPRLAGFRDQARKSRVTVDVSDIVYPYDWRDIEGFWERAGSWLRSLDRPLGVLAFTDRLGARLAKAGGVAGLHVPDDVAIVGYDNHEMHCLCATPPLSSVDANQARIGYEAAGLLDRMIDGAPPPQEPVLLPPAGVVARGSTDVIAIQDPLVSAAVRFIRDHATQEISAQDVYRAAHASRATVQPRFRKALGHTVSEEIWQTRLHHACLLLRETDMPLAEVAEASGFAGLSHFCRRFREHLGRTPKQYRRARTPPTR